MNLKNIIKHRIYMAKELSLNVGERMAVINLYNEYKGTTTGFVLLQEDIKKTALSEEDIKQVAMIRDTGKNKDGQEISFMKWDATKDFEKAIDFCQESVDFFRERIKAKNEAKEITMSDTALVSFSQKVA